MTPISGSTARAPRVPPPVIELRGAIAEDLVAYAREKVAHALDHGIPMTTPARVRVVRHRDPARSRPVVASAHVDVAGRRLHAHVVAATAREAVDLLVDRLRRQVIEARARRRPQHTGLRAGGRKPEPVISRHDVMQAVPTAIVEAVAVMEDRDEAFHLFVERSTGRRAVVYRGGATGRRVALDDGSEPASSEPDVTTSPHAARTISPERAVEHLRLAGLPFLFFHDPAVGHARVVHLDDRGRAVLVDVDDGGGVREPEAEGR